jgi:predicted dehydrogenase
MKPVLFGLAGLGGYAAMICRLLMEQSASDRPAGSETAARLIAVCDPDLERHAASAEKLRSQGVQVFRRWEELLAQQIEAVWLPLPIPLHRPYTEQALAAGKAVVCEKPAAGCVQDLDAMAAARDRSALPVAIGFQDIYKPSTRTLKQALVTGRIGKVRSATLTACWPRDSRYYGRSAWAGRQKQDGVWVMDSPASNALAHFLNLALFLLGESDSESASLASVEAELYRANPIENYDTCGLRLTTGTGVRLLVLFTHACRTPHDPRIVIHGERGTVTYYAGQSAQIQSEDDAQAISLHGESHVSMVERFAHLVRGVPDERHVATLEIARAHLVAVNGASEAAPARDVPASAVEIWPSAEDGELRTIAGIEDLFQQCAIEQRLPHETGLADWTSPPGKRDLRGYDYFSGPA